MKEAEEILKAKCKLYAILLRVEDNLITENELDILTFLSKDAQVQEFLTSKHLEEEKELNIGKKSNK